MKSTVIARQVDVSAFQDIIDNIHRQRQLDNPRHPKHYALIFRKDQLRWIEKLVYGYNMSVKENYVPSIHAEQNVLEKFFKLNKYRRFINQNDKIDIFVLRVSITGKIGNSRPCRTCIERMSRFNFVINNVYYTDADGTIKVEKLSDMLDSNHVHYSSGYLKQMNKY